MPTPIPPNLSPFVQPSRPGSLTLITSVLDATSNWLLLRYLYAALPPEQKHGHPTRGTQSASDTEGESREDKNEPLNVILVSFLRPFALWKEMAKKIGFDLPSLLLPISTSTSPRLTYIDAFTHLSFPPTSPTPKLPQPSHPKIHTLPPLSTLLALETQLLSHLPSATPSSTQSESTGPTTATYSSNGTHLLLIDALDLLLASSAPNAGVTPSTLISFLLTLRNRFSIQSTVLTLSADSPLLHNDSTPLSLSHREFLTSVAHQSDRVVQLRGLETGAARDVDGVLRISRGGAAEEVEAGQGGLSGLRREVPEEFEWTEGEWLYQVKGDGNVKLWARGE